MGSSLALILAHSFVSVVWEARPGPISTSYCSVDLKILAPHRQLETGLHQAGYSVLNQSRRDTLDAGGWIVIVTLSRLFAQRESQGKAVVRCIHFFSWCVGRWELS